MSTITIRLPEEVELQNAKLIIAAALFEKGILSSGQAAKIAGLSRAKFIEEIGLLGISIFGETIEDIEDLKKIEL